MKTNKGNRRSKMKNYYLAIDIGASSGRHILGHIEQGKIVLEEIWRFENGMQVKDGSLCWDLPYLYGEIKTGIKKCKELGKFQHLWGSIPGLWIMCFWMKMIR